MFLRELLFDVALEPTQQKGAQDVVQAADDVLVDRLLTLDHAGQRVAEPALELVVAGKDGGHEEMHQAPELHQVVLEWGACAGHGVCKKKGAGVFSTCMAC